MPNGISMHDVGGLGEYPVFHCTIQFLLRLFWSLCTHIGRNGGLILTIYTSYDVFPFNDVPLGVLLIYLRIVLVRRIALSICLHQIWTDRRLSLRKKPRICQVQQQIRGNALTNAK